MEESYFLVPKNWLETIVKTQERILALLEGSQKQIGSLGNYITEREAIIILGKKTTWFWKMRKSGKLSSTKIGGTNYYDKKDIILLLDNNKVQLPGDPFQK